MAEVVTTRVWEGLEVFQFTDTETGQVEIYKKDVNTNSPKGDLLARTVSTGSGSNIKNEWKFVDKDRFRIAVNNERRRAGETSYSDAKFTEEFYLRGANLFNQDRAKGLNNNSAYASTQVANQARGIFFQANIPGIIDPVTQLQVSSLGKKGTQPVNGTQTAPPASAPTQTQAQIEQEQTDLAVAAVVAAGTNLAIQRGRKRGGDTTAVYRYPLKPDGPFEYDYIRIRAYDYKPSQLGNSYKPDKNLGTGYETIILPMQPQLSETNGVSWSDDQLNPIQRLFGNTAIRLIGQDGFDFKKMGETFKNTLSEIKDTFLSDKTGEIKQAVIAYFAGQTVGANLLGRTAGMVINPNLELLFTGPNLRTFQFNFRLTPRSPEESEVCKKIIYTMKRNMAVARTANNLFLSSPRIFQLEYIFKGGGEGGQGQNPHIGARNDLHPYLNKFKPCALQNFAVNYTPDNSYATYFQTGSMTQFDISMSFTEIMPIYAEDNEPGDFSTMGY